MTDERDGGRERSNGDSDGRSRRKDIEGCRAVGRWTVMEGEGREEAIERERRGSCRER